jgi:hypothetical protein
MYEVLPTLPFALPFEALDELRWLVLGFCDFKWDPKRILALEEEITVDVECPDGVTRVLKGQPDILLADPPDGLVVIDAKSGRGRPKGPRVEPEAGEVVEGREYLSDLFQGDTYSLLGCAAIRRRSASRSASCTCGRARSVRHAGPRGAGACRAQAGGDDDALDRAIERGRGLGVVEAAAGCALRPAVPGGGVVPDPAGDARGRAIASPEQADAAARAWAVLEGTRTALLESIKAWAEDPANPLPRVNEREVYAWNPPLGKGRRFKLWAESDLVTASSEGST